MDIVYIIISVHLQSTSIHKIFGCPTALILSTQLWIPSKMSINYYLFVNCLWINFPVDCADALSAPLLNHSKLVCCHSSLTCIFLHDIPVVYLALAVRRPAVDLHPLHSPCLLRGNLDELSAESPNQGSATATPAPCNPFANSLVVLSASSCSPPTTATLSASSNKTSNLDARQLSFRIDIPVIQNKASDPGELLVHRIDWKLPHRRKLLPCL